MSDAKNTAPTADAYSKSKSSSPYFVGAAIGVLSWFPFWPAGHPLGVTHAYETPAALVAKEVDPRITNENEHFAEKEREGKPLIIGWEVMLVLGVFVGGLTSSSVSGDRGSVIVPQMWARRFGDSAALRLCIAFVAGALMMLGARLTQAVMGLVARCGSRFQAGSSSAWHLLSVQRLC
jgi:uncharacterized protein